MDVVERLTSAKDAIYTVEMHTVGEPTRIIYQGYPSLHGTLLEQRAQASQEEYDRIRRRLMLEPRGHRDMYGAILRPDTEHTRNGKAHMGVLFTTNDGYSTMCGHATIALARFLIDTHDLRVFPQRNEIQHDLVSKVAHLRLHAPCGIIEVTVPVIADGSRSHPDRPVSHISVPSFATGVDIRIDVPEHLQWPHLNGRTHVQADFSYGGAFYCLISASQLGFGDGLGKNVDIKAMDLATKNLKAAVNENPKLRYLFSHPDHHDLGFLYSVIVVDHFVGSTMLNTDKAETGLCYFSAQQIDRSPTGSGVAARVALAFAKDPSSRNLTIAYHSLLSNHIGGQLGFTGSVHEELGETADALPIVRAKITGYASYTGVSTFVVEEGDPLRDDGFLLEEFS